MNNQSDFNVSTSLQLAISFEGPLLKLLLKNRNEEWVIIGSASEEQNVSTLSNTEMEIFGIENPSKALLETSNNVISSVFNLSKQVKALSPENPTVEVWLPDEFILCQTLLQKNKLNQIEATELVAKSCKLHPSELCLVLSPNFRERSQKISAVSLEAIEQIKSYLENYGISANIFRAKNAQPGFDKPPTFFESEPSKIKKSLISRLNNKLPEIFATVLALITFLGIISDKTFQTQISVRTIPNLSEEGNFSLKSPLSLVSQSETTFPHFSPKLHSTEEHKVFQIVGYDIGSKLTPPQLEPDFTTEESVVISLGSSDISDNYALLVLGVKSLRPQNFLENLTYNLSLNEPQSSKPQKAELTALRLPSKPEKPQKPHEANKIEINPLFEYPSLNIVTSKKNNFEVDSILISNYVPLAPRLFNGTLLNDVLPTNYFDGLESIPDFFGPIKYKGLSHFRGNLRIEFEGPDITDNKITKLNINPIRLDQPNLLIDKILNDGEIGQIITEIPTANSEIEYVVLNKTSDVLPVRPYMKVRMALEEPTMSSGALAFMTYPTKRPETMDIISKTLFSKKRIKAKATAKPRIPKRSFAPSMATLSNRMELGRTNLLGIFGPKSNPYALIMLSSGEMIKLSVGDKFLGWRVYGIEESSVHIQNGRKQEILRIPG